MIQLCIIVGIGALLLLAMLVWSGADPIKNCGIALLSFLIVTGLVTAIFMKYGDRPAPGARTHGDARRTQKVNNRQAEMINDDNIALLGDEKPKSGPARIVIVITSASL